MPSCHPSVDYFPIKPELYHLKTAKLDYHNTYIDVTVTDTQGFSYLHRLVKCGCPVPNSRSLSQGDRIVAVGTPSIIYSPSIRSRISEGTNLSALSARSADIELALLSPFGVPGYKAANIPIPFFVNGETSEPTPLGRGEWIKIFALLFDTVPTGVQAFKEIEFSYNNVKLLANQAQRRPSVFLNFPFSFGGPPIWAMPSEKQYITQYLRDANVDYLYMNDGKNTTNFDTLQSITDKFKWARFLLLTGKFPASSDTSLSSFFLDESENSTNNAIAINEALRGLAAVRCANVWSRTKRLSELGANDFFELGAIRPDLILQDLVRAVHPTLEENNETTFSFKHVAKLVTNIIPEVSTDERIPARNIDALFQKPKEFTSTKLVLRTMVMEEVSDEVVRDSDKIAGSVNKALGDNANITVLSVKKSGQIRIDLSTAEPPIQSPEPSLESSPETSAFLIV